MLSLTRDQPIAITTVLQGAGGYGKTTLATGAMTSASSTHSMTASCGRRSSGQEGGVGSCSHVGAAPTTAAGALDAGYDPAFVDFFNKAGAKTYTGSVGDFAHRPQLGTHRVRSEGGVMQFGGGDLVLYAVISDEADPVSSDTTIACVGWEGGEAVGRDRSWYEWRYLPVSMRW